MSKKGTIKLSEQRKLHSKSGNRCAICKTVLVDVENIDSACIGVNAHIYGEKPGAARYDATKPIEYVNSEVDQYYIANSHEGIIERKIFDAVQEIFKTYEKNRQKYNQKVKSIFSKKVKCGDCGCTYKRNTKKGVFYWVCSNNGIAGQHCNTTNIKEDDLKQAFIRIFNRIKRYKGELVDYPINQLVAFKAKITRQNSDISEIDSEIAMLCNRNSMLNELKLRDVVDEVSYLEQSSQIQNRLSQLRKRRINILAEDEEEAVIEEFRKLKRIVEDENDYFS